MTTTHKAVLVTGANRGIGQALVEEALRRGADRVYAGTRGPLAHRDERVTPLVLDVTDETQIQAAVESVECLDLLINNAGIALYDDLSDRGVLEQHLTVNLFGALGVSQAFLPLLTRSQGAIVNNASMMAFAPLPLTPAYAVSKAALFNMTQSLRALLAPLGVRVHAVLTGPTDTDMTRGFEIPKATAESVARAIFDGVDNGERRHLPRPALRTAGRQLAQRSRQGVRAPVRGARQRNPHRLVSPTTQPKGHPMSSQNYSTSFVVDQTPDETFAAIKSEVDRVSVLLVPTPAPQESIGRRADLASGWADGHDHVGPRHRRGIRRDLHGEV